MLGRRQFLKAGGSWLLAAPLVAHPSDSIRAANETAPARSEEPGVNTTMKLICVEEHALDPAIGAATRKLVGAEAPYLGDWGSRVIDGRNVKDSSRAHVIAPSESARKGLDMGAGRLADMDAARITMQVLSYGGFPQLLPVERPLI
jgi:hypothetical protein